MTITTGKRTGRPFAVLSSLRLAPLAAGAMLLAGECRADWRVQPTLSLSETYTDNVRQQIDELKQSQFVTELSPGLVLDGRGRRFQVAGSGQFRKFIYKNDSEDVLRDVADHVVDYAFNGKGELAEDMLFIEASASSSQQAISAFGQQGGASPYSLSNRTEIKTWRISPYLEQRLGRAANLTLRYARDAVEADELRDRFGSSDSDTISASLASADRTAKLGWGLNYLRQELDSKIGGASSTETAAGNVRYAFHPRFALTASLGYDRYSFDSLGDRTAGKNWSAGFDWTPSARTRLNASLGRHFFGQTGKLDASHRGRRTVWRIIYDDAITNSREQFLLPSTVDTALLLDSLFAATIIDPVQRQQAVAAYIRQNGLSPSLANDVNFLSNRYFREKRFQASVAYLYGRSSFTVSLFATERIGLSNTQADSPLLGNQLDSLNSNVTQRGASASYVYRINSRTSAIAAADYSRHRSLTTGIENDPRGIRLSMTRQLGRDLRAAVEVRHQRGGVDVQTGGYRENAISASLSAQF